MANENLTLDDVLKVDTSLPNVPFLIDGDIVAYRAAAVTDGSKYKVKGFVGSYKYKKEAVEFCTENNLDVRLIENYFEPEPEINAIKIVKQILKGIKSNLTHKFPVNTFEIFLTGKENFRTFINAGYKSNRKGKRKPKHLIACKSYLVKEYAATYKRGIEADDLLGIRGTELGEGNCVICSIDKDLLQIPGWHYNFVKDEFSEVTFAEGRRLLWQQVISGDTTDAIYSPRGLGAAAAKKLYKNVDFDNATDDNLMEMAVNCYTTKLLKLGCIDTTNIDCWVEEVLLQVYLLRDKKDLSLALNLME